MAKEFYTGIDLKGNTLSDFVIENLSSAPTSPIVGRPYFDTTIGLLRVFNGTNWVSMGDFDIQGVSYKGGVFHSDLEPTGNIVGDMWIFRSGGQVSWLSGAIVQSGDFIIRNQNNSWDTIQTNVVYANNFALNTLTGQGVITAQNLASVFINKKNVFSVTIVVDLNAGVPFVISMASENVSDILGIDFKNEFNQIISLGVIIDSLNNIFINSNVSLFDVKINISFTKVSF